MALLAIALQAEKKELSSSCFSALLSVKGSLIKFCCCRKVLLLSEEHGLLMLAIPLFESEIYLFQSLVTTYNFGWAVDIPTNDSFDEKNTHYSTFLFRSELFYISLLGYFLFSRI